MTEVVLFHHARGLTDGVRAFADELRGGGHTVHTPDLYEGRTFDDLGEGVRHGAGEVGFDAIVERGRAAVADLPDDVVYVGLSLGVVPAAMLARNGALGAVFMYSCVDAGVTVPLQVHLMEGDPEVLPPNDDLEVARGLERAEVFLYPGDRHLFADPAAPDYDEPAATLLQERVLRFLDQAGRP